MRAGVSRPHRRREAVRVRPRELLEGRLPIASRCSITCALEDGLTRKAMEHDLETLIGALAYDLINASDFEPCD